MQNLNTRVSPTLPFQQSIGNLNGAPSSLTTATTMNTSPIWNSPFNLQQQPPPPPTTTTIFPNTATTISI